MGEGELAQEDFEDARDFFEVLMAKAAGAEDFTAARERQIAKVERSYPGFAERLHEHEARERHRIERVRIMPVLRADGAVSTWYGGPAVTVGEWPRYRAGLAEGGLPPAAIEAIDESTTRILGLSANPAAPGDRRKGLVIGYVQSGKTANYAGLIAKAVDAGYRIVIVLAGMYTNLRVQTQTRLERDLGMSDIVGQRSIAWTELTGPETDIGTGLRHGFLSNRGNVAVMVVKKHEKRLANVASFLKAVNRDSPEFLLERPVLIIDDESDQATPNTQGAKDAVSTINQRVRDIWREVRTGTYVAYTATPFANVFIDPDDAEDLYPDDFVVALPRPEGYMGADRFFGTSQTADADGEADAIYALAHEVPDEEARVLAPAGRDLAGFDPCVTDSLDRAIRWFILATAVRELRTGRARDSSMLVHTSHRTEAHGRLAAVITEHLGDLAAHAGDEEEAFRAVFQSEIGRAASLRGEARVPSWEEVWSKVRPMIEGAGIGVTIDNGLSTQRLVYDEDAPQTVIAIGGGTLSRGLTLEGLVVSYFLRTSNAYDTLLQMGRWFGFRPGYADLVRVWVGPGLLDDYAHLARVERELREEVEAMSVENRTPREMAVKVLAHPGRLEITGVSKMSAAVLARAGLGGTRRQTIYLDRSAHGARSAQTAVRNLVRRLMEKGVETVRADGPLAPVLFPHVSGEDLLSFLDEYWIAPSDRWLQPEAMRTWLAQHGAELSWNIVLASGGGTASRQVDLGGLTVGTVRRTPLKTEHWDPSRLQTELPAGSDVVNIRALMSGGDQMLDLRVLAGAGRLTPADARAVAAVNANDVVAVRGARRHLSAETGLVVIYLVDKDSKPGSDTPARQPMEGEEHLVGLGVVFPSVETEVQGEYWAVDLRPPILEDDPGIDIREVPDLEGDHVMGEGR